MPFLEDYAKGQQAQHQLQNLYSSPRAREAYDLSRSAPQLTGQGHAAYGGGPLEAIASLLNRRRGNEMLNQMDAQARALRGDVTAGKMAEMMEKERLEKERFDRQQKATMAQQEAIRSRMSAPELYVNPQTGEEKQVFFTPGGPVDEVGQATSIQGMRKAEKTREKKASQAFGKVPLSIQKGLSKVSNDISSLKFSKDSFKDSFSNPTDVPFTGSLSNWLARTAPALSTEESKERAEWWSNLSRLTELKDLHEQFGATLSRNESARWDAASINPNMDEDQIKNHLQTRLDILEDLQKREGDSVKIRYKAPEVEEFVDYLEKSTDSNSSRYARSRPETSTKKDKYSEMSDEEIQRLFNERLRGMAGG